MATVHSVDEAWCRGPQRAVADTQRSSEGGAATQRASSDAARLPVVRIPRPPATPPAAPPPRRRLLAAPAAQHGLLAVIAGRRGQLAVTLSSGSVPACAAHRGRLLAYCYIYTGTASMQAWSVNTASRMPESAWGWSILQDEPRRGRRGAARTRPDLDSPAARPGACVALLGSVHHRDGC